MRVFRMFSARSFYVTIGLIFSIPLGNATNLMGNASELPNPISLYGDKIVFDVFRGNERVGTHTVRFSRTGEDLIVNSRLEIKIDVLFFTVYRFLYQSDAIWRNGALSALNVEVDDNSEVFWLKAKRRGGVTDIQSTFSKAHYEENIYPTNHWNAGVLSETRVLNTLTGLVNNVSINAREREVVQTERGRVEATRFSYSGDLETEVWYDDLGRWVKMKFASRDGSEINYVCRRCQGSKTGLMAK
jgi:hypothetical protein